MLKNSQIKIKTLLLLSMTLTLMQPAWTSEIKALVIGNSGYKLHPLKNPVNDATDIAKTLRQMKFSVTEQHNLDRKGLRKTIRAFVKTLKSGDLGLFYYAGHGSQVDGLNYLIPVNADIDTEEDVPDEAVQANYILRLMEQSGNGVNVVIFDACRNNSYKSSKRSGTRGLAPLAGPVGSLVAFSTISGAVAYDGTNQRNSPYAKALIKYLPQSGLTLEQVFKRVRKQVKNKTNDQQIPVEESKLVDDIYLAGQLQQKKSSDRELLFWQSVQSSPSQAMYQAYLDKYPRGEFVTLAKIKVQQSIGADIGRELLERADHLYFKKYNSKAAFPVYLQAARKGNPMAMASTAKLYILGIGGIKKDIGKAKYWRDKAMPIILALAKQGNISAQYATGVLYSNVDKNYTQAVTWYRKAAELGNAYGMNNLGSMYSNGRGVSQDDKQAVTWYRKAAELGNADAMINLGFMYNKGHGVNQDYKQAVTWYRKAAKLGNAKAIKNLKILEEKL
jgi:uncharacterized protein